MSNDASRFDFNSLLRRTQAQLRGYIAGMGIAPHEVDDVAQDVYFELYRNFHKMPEEVAPERWLKGIARNLCKNHIRRISRRGRLHREALLDILERTEATMKRSFSEAEVGYALDECCEKLPPKSRRMLAMRYEDDMRSPAIATALDSTSEAIRSALYRVRTILRDCILQNLAGES